MKNRTVVELHPEFLRKAGRIEFVVLTYEEYLAMQEMLEDAEDLLDLRQAKEEDDGTPGTPLAEVKKEFGL